jgi:flavin reductase (DIM6/NTAB) family NADH-FMN oxidoreductase RutF
LPASAPDTPADTLAFRQLMGQFATGVAVISLVGETGAISAMTINSLVSVSLDPMLVSWCLQNSSSQFAAYVGAENFAFSILAEDQQALARRYAARGDSALLPEDFEPGESGLPVIRGALAHVACRRFAVHDAGDHTLILGAVAGMAWGAHGRRPLVFHGGRFAGLEQRA